MIIKILGTRGEIKPTAPYHSRHSGVLIDNTLLFDLGEQGFLKYNPKAIFITHLHPDHAFFTRKSEYPPTNIQIYAPEKYLNSTIKPLKEPITIENYRITPIPTKHSIKVASQAYLIEKKDKERITRVLYTGDMYWLEKKYQPKLLNLDLVITEASFIQKGGMIRRDKIHQESYGHTGIPDLIKLFSPYTNTILLTHFGSWFYNLGATNARRAIKEVAKKYKKKIIVGYDGLEIKLDAHPKNPSPL